MKNSRIKLLLLILAAIALFLFMAPHIIRTTILSENNVAYEQPIPSIAHGYTLSQQFIPQYDMLKSIEIYINSLSCSKSQGYLHVTISENNTHIIYENNIPLSALPDYGMTAIAEDIALTARTAYTLSIEAVDTIDDGPVVSFYPDMTAANKEEDGSVLTYAGLPLEASVLRASFYYDVPLSPINYIPYCLFIAFAILFCAEQIRLRS